ncbi:hypothetical protein HMPREF2531_01566 [Bacteroides intestinalis]|uniref:Uncharacterized protein n=2 Tax=Bacteroides TaxID=816 RepID=A0A139LMP7_9BACE|nr:hypothetical protein BACCELL_01842 [Bacteroides cellulosilyticus DSM 14838]KXT52730.1 hypothetical protein HMPREF2531_01566 [Bacteroides intestinalis]
MYIHFSFLRKQVVVLNLNYLFFVLLFWNLSYLFVLLPMISFSVCKVTGMCQI